MPDAPTILVVYGSARRDRQGIKFARYMVSKIEAAGATALLADSEDLGLPMLDRMYKEYAGGEAPEAMERMAGMIRAADGVIVVSGEYNHGIPAALKNLLDTYLNLWFFKPSGIACYSAGRFGGVRAAMQLRAVLAEIGMPTISTLFPVPGIGRAFAENGTPQEDWIDGAADAFLTDLTWWVEAARTQKAAKGTPY